jgi:fibronectin-binding autotransporter adhesin
MQVCRLDRHIHRYLVTSLPGTGATAPFPRSLHHNRILRAALVGAFASSGTLACAADMEWAGTGLLTNRWERPAAWAGGVQPGASDRAVFSNAVGGGAINNYATLDSGLVPMEIGAVQINATSTVLRMGVNESQRITHLYGIGGVGARNEAANVVRFFKFTELQGDVAFEAANAAGGGFEFTGGITPLGVPGHAGITLNGHNLTLNTVNASNVMTFTSLAGITGNGDVIKTGAGTVTLAGNAAWNNYTGATRLLGGTFALLGAGTIASSRLVDVAASASFDISGTTAGASIQNLGGAGSVLLGAQNLSITAASGRFDGVISGTGGLRVSATGRYVLGGANVYGGATQVDAGTLVAGRTGAFSATSAYTVAGGAGLDLAGFSHTLPSLTNAGTVSLVGGTPGTTLTLTGAYASNGGAVRLGTGATVSDRLVFDGAAATPAGQTQLQIVPLPGMGVATTGNGIEVISAINGATSTAQTTRDAFNLVGGHVDSGAFEYRLYAADAVGAGENWYLRSTVRPGALLPEVDAYRKDVPLLAAAPEQLRQADHSMLGNLHLRQGRVVSGEQRLGWARVISTDRISAQAGTVAPDSEGRFNGLQVGTHLWADASWVTGVYVGQLEGNARVRGFASGVTGAVGGTDLRSKYLGGYATFRRDGGFYVDSVLQGAFHRATVRPDVSAASNVKGASLMASVEVGQPVALGSNWTIEPQVQLMHQRLDLDTTTLSGVTTVHHDTANGWALRVGARLQGKFATRAGRLQPYGRFNAYASTHGTDHANFGAGTAASTTRIDTRTGGASTEIALGATLAMSNNVTLYGEMGKLWAAGGDARTHSGVSGSVGLTFGW